MVQAPRLQPWEPVHVHNKCDAEFNNRECPATNKMSEANPMPRRQEPVHVQHGNKFCYGEYDSYESLLTSNKTIPTQEEEIPEESGK